MFYNTTKTVFNRMSLELGRRPKDTVAIAGDRDSAQVAAENIRQEIEFRDNVQTGRMLNSVSAVPAGNGEFAVKIVDYGKYVNGYQREEEGSGFIDDAVAAAQLDGYDVDVVI